MIGSDLRRRFCGTIPKKLSKLPGMTTPPPAPLPEEKSVLLRCLQVQLLECAELKARAQALLDEHHYLGGVQAVGEQLHYAVTDQAGGWVAVLIFAAAAKHLQARDHWIGWSDEQRRRRLALVANNVRFLLLPDRTVPNLGSAVLARVLDRLSGDWQQRYGHPILVVETFVDPQRFRGTVYQASGWSELGRTQGHGRTRRDYYQAHDRPKALFARELCRNARRSLQAEHLKPALACVEQKVPARTSLKLAELQSLREHFLSVPDYRGRIGIYPVSTLLSIIACAHLADAPSGQKDLAAFAARLSQKQRRALGVRRQGNDYPSPSQPTFSRLYTEVGAAQVEQALLAHQRQVRGAPPPAELVALDGKQPKHSGGQNVVTAVTVPSLHYLGSTVVAEKTNEIPAARDLFPRLELTGRLVSLDALHTQTHTARELVLEHGADYLFTVKGNQPGVRSAAAAQLPPFAPRQATPSP